MFSLILLIGPINRFSRIPFNFSFRFYFTHSVLNVAPNQQGTECEDELDMELNLPRMGFPGHPHPPRPHDFLDSQFVGRGGDLMEYS